MHDGCAVAANSRPLSLLLTLCHLLQPERGWLGTAWEYAVARPLAGKPYPEGEWTHEAEESRFIHRHGVLFEGNKGEQPCHFSAAEFTEADIIMFLTSGPPIWQGAGLTSGRHGRSCSSFDNELCIFLVLVPARITPRHCTTGPPHRHIIANEAGDSPRSSSSGDDLKQQVAVEESLQGATASERREWAQHYASQARAVTPGPAFRAARKQFQA